MREVTRSTTSAVFAGCGDAAADGAGDASPDDARDMHEAHASTLRRATRDLTFVFMSISNISDELQRCGIKTKDQG